MESFIVVSLKHKLIGTHIPRIEVIHNPFITSQPAPLPIPATVSFLCAYAQQSPKAVACSTVSASSPPILSPSQLSNISIEIALVKLAAA